MAFRTAPELQAEVRPGTQVRVWPHGQPDAAAVATVQFCDRGYKHGVLFVVLDVVFDVQPPFAVTLHDPAADVRMWLVGYEFGPWLESFRGDHYEVEVA